MRGRIEADEVEVGAEPWRLDHLSRYANAAVHKDDVWHMIFVDTAPVLAVQYAPNHARPTWPNGERQQQVHDDLWVDDYASAHDEVMSLGRQSCSRPPARVGSVGPSTPTQQATPSALLDRGVVAPTCR
jgi:hypothetical protein